MGKKPISYSSFLEMSHDEQVSDMTLYKIETHNLLVLLISGSVSKTVKGAIIKHIIKTRIESDTIDNEQSNVERLTIQEFKTLTYRKQKSDKVLSSLVASDLVKILGASSLKEDLQIAVHAELLGRLNLVDESTDDFFEDNSSNNALAGTKEIANSESLDSSNSYPVLGCITRIFKFLGWCSLFATLYFLFTIYFSDDSDKYAQLTIICIPLGVFTLIWFGISEILKGIIKFFQNQSK